MRFSLSLLCSGLVLFLVAIPAMARIAPGADGACPNGLEADKQSGRCLPPGESRPALGAPNDPSSTTNPVKPVSAPVEATPTPVAPPEATSPKPLPTTTKEEEAQEACAAFPGTVARPLAGGYACVPKQ